MKRTLAVFIAFLCYNLHTTMAESSAIKDELMAYMKAKAPNGLVFFDDSFTDEMAAEALENLQSDKKSTRRRTLTLDRPFWNDTDKQQVLDSHNDYRSQTARGNTADDGTEGTYPSATNMNSFFWDSAVGSVAQAYAEGCDWGHNGDRSSQFFDYASLASFEYGDSVYIGENIAAVWAGSGYLTNSMMVGRVSAWFSENTLYHYSTLDSDAWDSGIGHFTQMVWANSRYLGCGWSVCESGTSYMYYMVCNYYPGGNYMNSYWYTSGSNYADCQPDRTDNADGLCAGCMSRSYLINSSKTNYDNCCDGVGRCVDNCDTTTECEGTQTLQSSSEGLSDGAVAGFVVLAIVIVILIVLLLVCLLSSKARAFCHNLCPEYAPKPKGDSGMSNQVQSNQAVVVTTDGPPPAPTTGGPRPPPPPGKKW